VNVTPKVVVLAEDTGDFDDHFHSVVGAANDAGGEKEALDVVSLVEIEGQPDDFLRGESGALDV
jgi:hypothetical protein